MDRSEVARVLRAFLQSEFPNESITLTETTDLVDEWFVDSLGIVQTVMFLESEFGVAVSRADINNQNFKSISTLTEFVSGRLS